MKNYRTIRNSIDSFAILNCEHKRLLWKLVGHTAMVYRDPLTRTLFVYESTQMSYSGVKGVQIHPLGEWLANYPGHVFLKRIFWKGGDIEPWEKAKDMLSDHIIYYRGTSYPNLKTRWGRWFLIKAAWDSWLFKKQSTNPETDKVFFCTHLVAHAFRFCGLADGYISSEFEPDDTRDGGKFFKYLKSDVGTHPEIQIK